MSGDESNSGGFKPSAEPRRELGGESASEKRRRLELARTVEVPAVTPKEKPIDPFGKTLTAIPAKPSPGSNDGKSSGDVSESETVREGSDTATDD